MKVQNRVIPVLVASALAMVGIAGCGSSGSKTLNKADFISQADAICATTTTKVNALGTPADTASVADIVTFIDKTLAIVQPALQQLSALKASSSDAAVLQQNLIAPTKSQDDQATRFLDAVKKANGDTTAEQAALTAFGNTPDDPNQDTHDKALSDFGFSDCAKTNDA